MENRRLVIGLILAMAIAFLWQPAFVWIGKRLGYDMTPHPAQSIATTEPAPPGSAAPPTTGVAATGPSGSALSTAAVRVAPATEPSGNIIIGSSVANDENDHMALSINPRGAALDWVTLNEFKRAAGSQDPYIFQQPYGDSPDAPRAFATRWIKVNGTDVNLYNVEWELEQRDARKVVLKAQLITDSGVVGIVRKTYQLLGNKDEGQGYEILISHSVQNLTAQPMQMQVAWDGAHVPARESDRGGDRQLLAGYAAAGQMVLAHDLIESFAKDKANREYTVDKDGNKLVWAGLGSIYFQALTRPLPSNGQTGVADYLGEVSGKALNPDAPGDEHQLVVSYTTRALTIAPAATLEMPARVFFGPKQRVLLKSDYYSSFPRNYNLTLVLTSGVCSACTFQWLIDVLVWLLRSFHLILRDWGLAIIALVVLVRSLLHPITKRSQISMSRMSKMGPEMEKLKKKYGDDKDGLNKAMMGFYKEQGVTPILGCLPMFLQMPIWIALWQALQTTFELRQAPFLWGFTWIHDLSKPDHLIELAHPFNLFGFLHVSGLNVLPLLMAGVFFIQAKMQPKPVATTPEQAQQQKMMQWMTLLFPIMLYSGPSGLNLYIMTSTAIGIVESKIVRDHIKQREEDEKNGVIIVNAGKKSRSSGTDSLGRAEAEKPKGLLGWWEEFQKKIDPGSGKKR